MRCIHWRSTTWVSCKASLPSWASSEFHLESICYLQVRPRTQFFLLGETKGHFAHTQNQTEWHQRISP